MEIEFMFCGGCKFNKSGSCKLEILTPCGLVPTKDCYYKQLQQLKAENEEIRKVNNANAKLMIRLRNCLDEIEDLCKVAKDSNTGFYTLCDVVMLKIKEVKGNE